MAEHLDVSLKALSDVISTYGLHVVQHTVVLHASNYLLVLCVATVFMRPRQRRFMIIKCKYNWEDSGNCCMTLDRVFTVDYIAVVSLHMYSRARRSKAQELYLISLVAIAVFDCVPSAAAAI